MSYTKLFQSILGSSIWSEDDQTRIVWITMLALANKHGEVEASIPGLARLAGVPLDACEAAVATLSSPDKYSKTPDHEGRRIMPIDGGWEIVNHHKYRDKASRDDSKRKTAERVRRHRARKRSDVTPNVTPCNGSVTVDAHIADTDTDTDTERKNTQRRRGSQADCVAHALSLDLPASDGEWFFDSMEAGGWTRGGKPLKDWQAHMRSYKRQGWLPSLKNQQDGPAAGAMREDGRVFVAGQWRTIVR